MVEIIENPKRMTKEEIFASFKGKWVFMVDIEEEAFGPWYSAVPVVIAAKGWAGKETGIYDRLIEKHNDNWLVYSFLNNELNVFGFSEVDLQAKSRGVNAVR